MCSNIVQMNEACSLYTVGNIYSFYWQWLVNQISTWPQRSNFLQHLIFHQIYHCKSSQNIQAKSRFYRLLNGSYPKKWKQYLMWFTATEEIAFNSAKCLNEKVDGQMSEGNKYIYVKIFAKYYHLALPRHFES